MRACRTEWRIINQSTIVVAGFNYCLSAPIANKNPDWYQTPPLGGGGDSRVHQCRGPHSHAHARQVKQKGHEMVAVNHCTEYRREKRTQITKVTNNDVTKKVPTWMIGLYNTHTPRFEVRKLSAKPVFLVQTWMFKTERKMSDLKGFRYKSLFFFF